VQVRAAQVRAQVRTQVRARVKLEPKPKSTFIRNVMMQAVARVACSVSLSEAQA
jgi:hypothetical protein